MAIGDGNAAVFPQFDVVSDASDHYYAKNKNTGAQFQKTIAKEWRILQNNLPDSIFVRAYEDRTDLMRVAIVGAAGTPYHDGLFFFDIAFPANYPSDPPSVRYRSFGFQINPNLFSNGWVCLSLLNTWFGKKNEKWNRARSTVLQVLVSIQALVLNEKPYFNEALFGRYRGRSSWENVSESYNRDVFVLCCKTMVIQMRTPLKHFEALIAGHYKERGHSILYACIVYANGGAKIGHWNSNSNSGNVSKVSRYFKRSIERLYRQLYAGFSKNGASLGDLGEQFQAERWKKDGGSSVGNFIEQFKGKKKMGVEEKENGGIGKTFARKLRKIFGISKKSEIVETTAMAAG